jgi:predicted dehydrogenase
MVASTRPGGIAVSDSIRVGFAGAGFAAGFHFESLGQVKLPGILPHGVYSRTKEKTERFARGRGLRVYDSLEGLLDNVDVVHVCVPAAAHEEVTVKALDRNVQVILEKPFTGYFGPAGDASFRGNAFPKETMRAEVLRSIARMQEAESRSTGRIYYAENWVFAPVIRKEEEIVRKTRAQLLWMIGQEAHSGSHSAAYGKWRESGGGSIMGKGTHPLTAVLHLKRVEGETRLGRPIRPRAVSARTHELTRLSGYEDRGFLRTEYTDVEDFGLMHVIFEDGTIGDVYSSEIVMGGVDCWIEVLANNHRTRCTISATDGLRTYNPREEQFAEVYVTEKIGTKQGWSNPAPDENWAMGYVHELDHFYRCIRQGAPSFSSAELGADTAAVIYAAYLSAERRGAEVAVR